MALRRRAGSPSRGKGRSSWGGPAGSADEIFGPDALALARFDVLHGTGDQPHGGPYRDVELAAQANRHGARLATLDGLETDGAQQLRNRLGREDGHVRQVAVHDLAGQQPGTISRLNQQSPARSQRVEQQWRQPQQLGAAKVLDE